MNLYVIFSAMSLSPMSKTGYIDSDGMNRGSAIVALNARDTAKVMSTVYTSSVLSRRPSGTHSGHAS